MKQPQFGIQKKSGKIINLPRVFFSFKRRKKSLSFLILYR